MHHCTVGCEYDLCEGCTCSRARYASLRSRTRLGRADAKAGRSAFSFLFSEFVQYTLNRVTSTDDLNKKLEEAGHGIGLRVLELTVARDPKGKRETKLIGILQFIAQTVRGYLDRGHRRACVCAFWGTGRLLPPVGTTVVSPSS